MNLKQAKYNQDSSKVLDAIQPPLITAVSLAAEHYPELTIISEQILLTLEQRNKNKTGKLHVLVFDLMEKFHQELKPLLEKDDDLGNPATEERRKIAVALSEIGQGIEDILSRD